MASVSKKRNKNKTEPKNETALIFKRYRLLKNIGEGAFGSVFLGINLKTNEKVAIKIEERKIPKPSLEREAYILYSLKIPGLPKLITFGRNKKYNILVQELLGKSLYQIHNDYNKKFSVKDTCILAIQIINIIEIVHGKNYIHCDIKPQNILIGNENLNLIYLIDFGLAKKYRSDRGNHVKFSVTKRIIGTPRFCSINAMRGIELSRKDDLESIAYMVIYFIKGNLPWQGLKIEDSEKRFKKITEIKKNSKTEELCKGLPKEIWEFYDYTKNLEFEENPDYDYMRGLFYNVLNNLNAENDIFFSWSNKDDNNKILTNKNITRKGRNSSHQRLFRKIQISLEKKRKESEEKAGNNLTIINNMEIKNNEENKEINNISLNTINTENNGKINISDFELNNRPNQKSNEELPNKLINLNGHSKELSQYNINNNSLLSPNKILNENGILQKNMTTIKESKKFEYHFLPISWRINDRKPDNNFLSNIDYIKSIKSSSMSPDFIFDYSTIDRFSKIEKLKTQLMSTIDLDFTGGIKNNYFMNGRDRIRSLNNNFPNLKLDKFLREQEINNFEKIEENKLNNNSAENQKIIKMNLNDKFKISIHNYTKSTCSDSKNYDHIKSTNNDINKYNNIKSTNSDIKYNNIKRVNKSNINQINNKLKNIVNNVANQSQNNNIQKEKKMNYCLNQNSEKNATKYSEQIIKKNNYPKYFVKINNQTSYVNNELSDFKINQSEINNNSYLVNNKYININNTSRIKHYNYKNSKNIYNNNIKRNRLNNTNNTLQNNDLDKLKYETNFYNKTNNKSHNINFSRIANTIDQNNNGDNLSKIKKPIVSYLNYINNTINCNKNVNHLNKIKNPVVSNLNYKNNYNNILTRVNIQNKRNPNCLNIKQNQKYKSHFPYRSPLAYKSHLEKNLNYIRVMLDQSDNSFNNRKSVNYKTDNYLKFNINCLGKNTCNETEIGIKFN